MDPNTAPAPTAEQPAYTPFIPRDQDKKADLAVRLAAAWKLNPQLVFIWITQALFETMAADYHKAIVDKTAAAALRGGITLSMEEADEKITEGLPYLKAALLTKFKKGGDKAKHAEFGIIAHNKGYFLPDGHTERAKALTMLRKALATYGLEGGEFGSTYWAPIEAAYVQGDSDAKKSSSTVSGLVGTKNTLEDQVDQVLSKMLTLLEAQYPDETELAAMRRVLGYLKEYN